MWFVTSSEARINMNIKQNSNDINDNSEKLTSNLSLAKRFIAIYWLKPTTDYPANMSPYPICQDR